MEGLFEEAYLKRELNVKRSKTCGHQGEHSKKREQQVQKWGGLDMFKEEQGVGLLGQSDQDMKR